MKTVTKIQRLLSILIFGSLAACSTKTTYQANNDLFNDPNPPIVEEELVARQAGEVTYDIPIVRNPKVETWINYFQGRGKKWFRVWLERSGKYIPFMRRILKEHGLPEDLVYLSMIESGFSPKAYSRARAVGPWQFMYATGRMYGLKRDFWKDERRDPEKATVAAARHLKDLYDEFESWKLAAAAYNAGSGKVRRAIKRYRTEDFWELTKGRYLRNETKHYVPKIIAAALVAKEPEKYGFTNIEYQAPLEYDKIILSDAVNLEVLAERSGSNLADIMALNPELNHPVTPPNIDKYELRIPAGMSQPFLQAYNGLEAREKFQYTSHRLGRGQTLSHVSRKYGVPVREIMGLNKIRNARRLRAGQTLLIPVPQGMKVATFRSIPNRSNGKVYYRSTTSSRQTYRPKKAGSSGVYRVRSGDTLWSIAQVNGVSVSALKSQNGLRYNKIKVGQKLYIPGRTKTTVSAGSLTGVSRASPEGTYKVRRGDTLWSIAQTHGVSVRTLKEHNNLRRSTIKIGETLSIPNSSSSVKKNSQRTTASKKRRFHVVRRGDTLWDIAQAYGVSVRRLKLENSLGSNLYPGTKLVIPST